MIKTRPSLKTSIKVACGLALISLMSTSLSARELRLASGVPPVHPAHTPLYTSYQKMLPDYSDGRLTGRIFGPEITTLGNMRESIRSGVVEVGVFLPAYFPADLPNFNLVGDLSLLGTTAQATAAAATEYMMTCEDCMDEFKELGAVYGTSIANPYNLLTRQAVKTPEDLQGLRIRVATPQHARWVESVGGNPVRLTTGEVFEALSQGVVDGTIASPGDLVAFNLSEVVTHITRLELGTFHSISAHTVKDSTWKSLSAEDREAMLKASFRAAVLTTDSWSNQAAQGVQVANDKNIPILEPSAPLVEAVAEFKEQDLDSVASSAGERFGISSAGDKITRFQALVEKWEGLIAETDGSVDAIADLYESEILTQVDVSSYGL